MGKYILQKSISNGTLYFLGKDEECVAYELYRNGKFEEKGQAKITVLSKGISLNLFSEQVIIPYTEFILLEELEKRTIKNVYFD